VHYTKGVQDASTCTRLKPARSARYVSLLLLCIYCEFRRPAPPEWAVRVRGVQDAFRTAAPRFCSYFEQPPCTRTLNTVSQYIVHACMQTALHHTRIEVCTTPKASRTPPRARGSNRPAQPVMCHSCCSAYIVNSAGPRPPEWAVRVRGVQDAFRTAAPRFCSYFEQPPCTRTLNTVSQYIVHACMQTALHHTRIEVCTTPKASWTPPHARGSNRPARPVMCHSRCWHIL
jgi:hypothetical protein